jgi:hypothetical protein
MGQIDSPTSERLAEVAEIMAAGLLRLAMKSRENFVPTPEISLDMDSEPSVYPASCLERYE